MKRELGIALALAGLAMLALVLTGWKMLFAYLAAMSLTTLGYYGYDKHQARGQGRRVREATLHTLAALGGTPGALVAQSLFRHKTRDANFRRGFWAIALAQATLLVLYVVF